MYQVRYISSSLEHLARARTGRAVRRAEDLRLIAHSLRRALPTLRTDTRQLLMVMEHPRPGSDPGTEAYAQHLSKVKADLAHTRRALTKLHLTTDPARRQRRRAITALKQLEKACDLFLGVGRAKSRVDVVVRSQRARAAFGAGLRVGGKVDAAIGTEFFRVRAK